MSLERHHLPDRSATFDGRDVFAPAGAEIAAGMPLAELGPALDPATLTRLDRPAPQLLAGGTVGLVVVQVDGYGNVQLGGDATVMEALGGRGAKIELSAGEQRLTAAAGATFADAPPGQPIFLVDSDGCPALSVNKGRADTLLGGLRPGDSIRVRKAAG